ncbi:MAG: acyl-CoA thioesterase [Nitrososphaerales archaeon]
MFRSKMRVAWVDTDAAGIVHFSNYLRYFERVEEEMYRELGLTFQLIASNYNVLLPRIESRSKYLAPCRQGDEIEVEITFSQIRDRSYEEEYRIQN